MMTDIEPMLYQMLFHIREVKKMNNSEKVFYLNRTLVHDGTCFLEIGDYLREAEPEFFEKYRILYSHPDGKPKS